jgi:pimeloyl-ACP methyl ester carboxylesterase
MSMLADDVAGLIDALGLDRPAVAGFSEGGLVALLLGLRHPDSIRALVCDSGYDMLNPDAPAFAMLPALLGGLEHVDPDVVEESFGQDPEMAEVFALMKTDQDAARGEGSWRGPPQLRRPAATDGPTGRHRSRQRENRIFNMINIAERPARAGG